MKKALLLFYLFSGTLLTAQNIPSYVDTNGLIGYWPLDGNANDESGNGYNGTVYGAVLTNDRKGNPNQAYKFDGNNDYLNFSNINTLPQSNTPRTISFWAKNQGSNSSNNQQSILNYGTISYNKRCSVIYWAQNGSIAFIGEANDLPSNGFTMDTLWNHFVIRFDGLNAEIIINDSIYAQSGKSYQTLGSTLFLGFNGTLTHHNGEFFNGIIDDVIIWNRALTYPEVSLLYSGCSDTITSEPTSNTFQTVPGTAHFTTAHSDTTATYQWQQNNGTGWTNLSDFGFYSGTTTDSLVLTDITTTLNGYGYRCIIDACTMDTTDVAFLTIVDNVGIEESAVALTISPNPTSGLIYVDIKANYCVYSMSGQKVAEGKTEGQIDLSSLPTGSYNLILITEEGRITRTIQKI